MDTRIFVFGWAKSGTTALYYKIMNSYGGEERVQGLFEPKGICDIEEEVGKDVLLVKALWYGVTPQEFESWRFFDKKIWISRDPRDFMISRYLYHWNSKKRKRKLLSKVIDTLNEKEVDPLGTPVYRIFEDPIIGVEALTADSMKRRIRQTVRFLKEHEDDLFVYQYEDMIDGKWNELENYLGRKLTGEAEIPSHKLRVVRSKAYGNWRHWFTEEDVAYYKPQLEGMMRELGYEDDWSLADQPVIDPATSSGYVLKLVNELLPKQT